MPIKCPIQIYSLNFIKMLHYFKRVINYQINIDNSIDVYEMNNFILNIRIMHYFKIAN